MQPHIHVRRRNKGALNDGRKRRASHTAEFPAQAIQAAIDEAVATDHELRQAEIVRLSRSVGEIRTASGQQCLALERPTKDVDGLKDRMDRLEAKMDRLLAVHEGGA